MRRGVICLVLIVALSVVSVGSTSTSQVNTSRCLQFTTAKVLPVSKILKDLALTSEQVSVIRSRLLRYNTKTGWQGVDDLGLPPDVVAEISRRIQLQVAAWNRYPLGYPCLVFQAPTKTKTFVRNLLVDNGFRPASVSIWKTSARQFQLRGIQDGYEFFGIVAKTAKRQVVIYLTSPTANDSQTTRFSTPFEA